MSTVPVRLESSTFERRKVPRAVRRRRFLVSVANHSLLIAAAIAFAARL